MSTCVCWCSKIGCYAPNHCAASYHKCVCELMVVEHGLAITFGPMTFIKTTCLAVEHTCICLQVECWQNQSTDACLSVNHCCVCRQPGAFVCREKQLVSICRSTRHHCVCLSVGARVCRQPGSPMTCLCCDGGDPIECWFYNAGRVDRCYFAGHQQKTRDTQKPLGYGDTKHHALPHVGPALLMSSVATQSGSPAAATVVYERLSSFYKK